MLHLRIGAEVSDSADPRNNNFPEDLFQARGGREGGLADDSEGREECETLASRRTTFKSCSGLGKPFAHGSVHVESRFRSRSRFSFRFADDFDPGLDLNPDSDQIGPKEHTL
ncbi:hypothetical protein EVAR_17022_1 [Eumeta japonica]|uniref:Uncharacterized protein n=1 Tax=Eumeta variegata TaxID=151549 RepID=A0A4C1TW10_EUMVA|nr:hypothetical protein EVAR_17022_1 [Eumeta japonica]